MELPEVSVVLARTSGRTRGLTLLACATEVTSRSFACFGYSYGFFKGVVNFCGGLSLSEVKAEYYGCRSRLDYDTRWMITTV